MQQEFFNLVRHAVFLVIGAVNLLCSAYLFQRVLKFKPNAAGDVIEFFPSPVKSIWLSPVLLWIVISGLLSRFFFYRKPPEFSDIIIFTLGGLLTYLFLVMMYSAYGNDPGRLIRKSMPVRAFIFRRRLAVVFTFMTGVILIIMSTGISDRFTTRDASALDLVVMGVNSMALNCGLLFAGFAIYPNWNNAFFNIAEKPGS